MARKFLTNIDLANNHIVNALLEVIAGNPASPTDARIWYDSTNSTVKVQIAGTTIDLLARANQTGTQLAVTISDFTAAVQALKWASMAQPITSVAMNGQKFTGLAAGSAGGDSVEYGQFQTAIANVGAGVSFKTPARVTSTANIASLSGLITVDGVVVAAGDRVLIKNQATATQNGIYVAASGAWSFSTDSLTAGDVVPVSAGSAQADTGWMLTTTGTITQGTTAQSWTQFGAGQTYTAASAGGLTLASNAFSALANTGVTVSSSGIGADFSIVARKFTGTFTGNGATTSFAVTHNLNNSAPHWSIYIGTQQIDGEFQPSSANAGSFVFGTAPATGTYVYTITG